MSLVLDHISHSQIEMWHRCPRQWEYRYVHGLKIPPSGALVEGGCYHKALEVNFRQKVNTYQDLPVDDCLDAFSTEWEARLAEEELVVWERLGPGEVKDEGYGLVREYMLSISPEVQPTKVEERHVSEIGDVKLFLVCDLEDEDKKVIDHKTSSKAYTQDDVDRSLQAGATAFALKRAILYYNHVAIKSKVPRIQIIRTYRTIVDIEWWEKMALQVLAQMQSGIAPPRPTGWWCNSRFCGYWEMCRGELARSYA